MNEYVYKEKRCKAQIVYEGMSYNNEVVRGQLIRCDGDLNNDRCYILPECKFVENLGVSYLNYPFDVIIGDFIEVDPSTVYAIEISLEWEYKDKEVFA